MSNTLAACWRKHGIQLLQHVISLLSTVYVLVCLLVMDLSICISCSCVSIIFYKLSHVFMLFMAISLYLFILFTTLFGKEDFLMVSLCKQHHNMFREIFFRCKSVQATVYSQIWFFLFKYFCTSLLSQLCKISDNIGMVLSILMFIINGQKSKND